MRRGDIGVTSPVQGKQSAGYKSVGKCQRPIVVIDPCSGELQEVRCGSRLVRQCVSCSKIAQKDYQKIIESGFVEVDPRHYRFFLLTLTAPSFGVTHYVPGDGDRPRKCRCGRRHDSKGDAGLRGVAVDPETYDYAGCVQWNYGLGRLWDATRSRLSKEFAESAYVKVGEFQARGALHVHVLVRLPRTGERSADVAKSLLSVCRSVETREGLLWGQSAGDCQRVVTGETQDKVAFYMTKVLAYVTKDSMVLGHEVDLRAIDHFERLEMAARHMRCDRCRDWAEPCNGLAHRRWGARSSVMSKSRGSRRREGWSALRRLDLRERRVKFAQLAEKRDVALEVLARSVAEKNAAMRRSVAMLI